MSQKQADKNRKRAARKAVEARRKATMMEKATKPTAAPQAIKCNQCGQLLVCIKDVKGAEPFASAAGITAAYAAECSVCGGWTYAMSGDHESIADVFIMMEDHFGQKLPMGAICSKPHGRWGTP